MSDSTPPTRMVALLRAINVGGHRIIKMADLRAMFAAWGFTNVSTHIQTGNVIFDASSPNPDTLAQQITGQIEATVGFAVTTFVRTLPELQQFANNTQWADERANGATLYGGFLQHEPDPEHIQRLAALASPIDDFAVVGRDLLWLSRKQLGASKLSGTQIEKALGQPTTLRNWNVITAIAALYR